MSLNSTLPISAEVNNKLLLTYPNRATYNARISTFRTALMAINTTEYSMCKLSIADISIDRLIQYIKSIKNSNTQKTVLYSLIKLAEIEDCFEKMRSNLEFMYLTYLVVANNYIIRNSKTLSLIPITWEEVIKKSNECINRINFKHKVNNKFTNWNVPYSDLNQILMAIMIRDMPILRSSEYQSIMLIDNETNSCNYIKGMYNIIGGVNNSGWSFLLRNHKTSQYTGDREIPLSQSVIDMMRLYARDFWNLPDEPTSASLLKNFKGRVSTPETPLNVIKKIYGKNITIQHLRILSASKSADLDIEERVKLARYMGHSFECHQLDYVRE